MKKRIYYLDVLKVISMLAVIFMHVIGNTIHTFNLNGTPLIVYSTICELMYFAVPMFIMISGALFLNPEHNVNIKKSVLKLISCLFIFGILYSLIEIYFNNQNLNYSSLITSVSNVFTGNLWNHMWYLYLIIGLYLLTPLLRVFIKNCSLKEYQYILILLFVFTIIIPDIASYFNVNIAFNVLITSPYIFFYLFGYYLSKYELNNKVENMMFGLGFVAIMLIILENIYNIFNPVLISSYTTFIIFLIIVSLFLLTKRININSKYGKIFKILSECNLGIYLIHQLFINIIFKYLKFDFILKNPYVGLFLYVLIIYIISFALVYILRKIKFVKKYLL
jgi:surface polysaccharide O-acyltransferase-like enzyme